MFDYSQLISPSHISSMDPDLGDQVIGAVLGMFMVKGLWVHRGVGYTVLLSALASKPLANAAKSFSLNPFVFCFREH